MPRVGDALLAHCLNCIRLRRSCQIHSHHSIPHQLPDGPQICLSADPARVTHHPEVTLGSLGEFETCPDWVPVMDTGQLSRIALKTMGDHGFDQRANRVAKVRKVSRLGSQNQFRHLKICSLSRLAGSSDCLGPKVDSHSSPYLARPLRHTRFGCGRQYRSHTPARTGKPPVSPTYASAPLIVNTPLLKASRLGERLNSMLTCCPT